MVETTAAAILLTSPYSTEDDPRCSLSFSVRRQLRQSKGQTANQKPAYGRAKAAAAQPATYGQIQTFETDQNAKVAETDPDAETGAVEH
jgi:hypothetical protein